MATVAIIKWTTATTAKCNMRPDRKSLNKTHCKNVFSLTFICIYIYIYGQRLQIVSENEIKIKLNAQAQRHREKGEKSGDWQDPQRRRHQIQDTDTKCGLGLGMKAKMRHMPKIFNRSSAHRNFAYNFSPFSGFQVLYRIKGYIVSKEKYVINRKNVSDPIIYHYLSMTF